MKWEKIGRKKNPFVDQNPKCHLQGLKINDASMNLQARRERHIFSCERIKQDFRQTTAADDEYLSPGKFALYL